MQRHKISVSQQAPLYVLVSHTLPIRRMALAMAQGGPAIIVLGLIAPKNRQRRCKSMPVASLVASSLWWIEIWRLQHLLADL
jgi:hypothetical protein